MFMMDVVMFTAACMFMMDVRMATAASMFVAAMYLMRRLYRLGTQNIGNSKLIPRLWKNHGVGIQFSYQITGRVHPVRENVGTAQQNNIRFFNLILKEFSKVLMVRLFRQTK